MRTVVEYAGAAGRVFEEISRAVPDWLWHARLQRGGMEKLQAEPDAGRQSRTLN